MSEPRPGAHAPAGLITALLGALLLLAAFGLHTWATPMPPPERWAALTTMALLALLIALPGSPGLYDLFGRSVRHDWRALITSVALLPVLYISYSAAVGEFYLVGALHAGAFVLFPLLLLWPQQSQRVPTLLDGTAFLYVLVSLALALPPTLTLPQQDGAVGFFALATVPLLLALLAARGWPGLGYTWFLSWPDVRAALLTTAVLLVSWLGLALLFDLPQRPVLVPDALVALTGAVLLYAGHALPYELLLRGAIQNGLQRWLEARTSPRARFPFWLSLGVGALLGALAAWALGGLAAALLAGLAGLGAGWLYHRTGKVTAAAVAHALLVWLVHMTGFLA